ncbi:hypothetical protein GCM10009840_01010 [Pseudolysinimonas kribbensis]|uniref:hypothetical protein n=1 Tax=Pseudolysinimonas kribbensis TaxID=433641 RepID=UPI0031D11687
MASIASIGAARAPGAAEGCLLGIICTPSSPSPSPSPTSGGGTGTGTGSGGGGLGGLLGGGSSSDPQDNAGGLPPVPLVASPDDSMTFTLPAAQLGGSSISFGSIPVVSLVTVPLKDGSRTTVIRLQASSVTINDFVLDVRKTAGGDSGVTTSRQMVLSGHVSAYIDSATATLPGGLGLTLGADTPLPGDELPQTLLGVHLGLVGVISDRMTMTPSHLVVTQGH